MSSAASKAMARRPVSLAAVEMTWRAMHAPPGQSSSRAAANASSPTTRASAGRPSQFKAHPLGDIVPTANRSCPVLSPNRAASSTASSACRGSASPRTAATLRKPRARVASSAVARPRATSSDPKRRATTWSLWNANRDVKSKTSARREGPSSAARNGWHLGHSLGKQPDLVEEIAQHTQKGGAGVELV